MTHSEKRGHWLREGLLGLSTGVLYGMTSVAVGHPLDTVKTKMQAQSGFLEAGGGTLSALSKVWKAEGIRGLYRGWIPPLWGSGLYRSSQFAVYEALYTKWDANRASAAAATGVTGAAPVPPLPANASPALRAAAVAARPPNANTVIPFTFGLETRVLQAAWFASLARALIECPIEFAKVARQTGQSWKLRQVYTGFGVQWARTWGVMTTYFILIDSTRRHAPSLFSNPLGQFAVSAGAATLGFWIVWPAEVLKNQVQAATGIYDVRELRARGITLGMVQAASGANGTAAAAATAAGAATAASTAAAAVPSLPAPLSSPSLLDRVRYLLFTHGFAGLYRGIGPGTARSVLSNGVSMVVMLQAQRKITEWGWRD